jgi:hypothetical protein
MRSPANRCARPGRTRAPMATCRSHLPRAASFVRSAMNATRAVTPMPATACSPVQQALVPLAGPLCAIWRPGKRSQKKRSPHRDFQAPSASDRSAAPPAASAPSVPPTPAAAGYPSAALPTQRMRGSSANATARPATVECVPRCTADDAAAELPLGSRFAEARHFTGRSDDSLNDRNELLRRSAGSAPPGANLRIQRCRPAPLACA